MYSFSDIYGFVCTALHRQDIYIYILLFVGKIISQFLGKVSQVELLIGKIYVCQYENQLLQNSDVTWSFFSRPFTMPFIFKDVFFRWNSMCLLRTASRHCEGKNADLSRSV